MTRLTVSVPEAAKLLGLSRSSTYEAVRRGDLPSIRVGGRVLIPIQRLESLINDETSAETEATSELSTHEEETASRE
jgi:excisionase family DNA binding protein